MAASPGGEALRDGLEALAAGQWEAARAALQEATEAAESAVEQLEAIDGLGEALWWLGAGDAAIAARERAYALCVETGAFARAARIAVWVAREYRSGLGNTAAASGWLARAETVAATVTDPAIRGWVSLARAEQCDHAADERGHTEAALQDAREAGDRDLELLALSALGLALVRDGDHDLGVARLDEAMAAATAGEAGRLSTVAEVYCQLAAASAVTGDSDRFGAWSEVIERPAARPGLPLVAQYCDCCKAEVSAVHHDWASSEKHLKQAMDNLERSGQRPRCLSATARLADVWLLQGRIEETERLLAGDETHETLVARAQIALVRGDHRLATTLADRFLRRQRRDTLAAVPALHVLAEAAVADGDRQRAVDLIERLDVIAASAGAPRVAASAANLRARLAVDEGDFDVARRWHEQALDVLAPTPSALEAGRAHLGLAEIPADTDGDRGLAVAEARAALAVFDASGSRRDADRAAAVLRRLGDRSNVGRKGGDVLTVREQEVLRLLGLGLTNAEIGARLFISVKTAGNHVSSILSKLQLRSRSEAAAYVVIHAAQGDRATN